jgi:hypothetical protein
MKKSLFLSAFLSIFLFLTGIAQPVRYINREIRGSVVDSATHAPLLYASIYVDQFDDNLWSGYSIIEPTKRMKEYKKQAEFNQ